MLVLTKRLSANENTVISLTLPLNSEDRTRSRYRWETAEGKVVHLRLPRGTVLRDRDILTTDGGEDLVRVIAKPEPVMTVVGKTPLDLLKAAYHLGNRHVPLELTLTYLRLSSDPVLGAMLEQLGLKIIEEVAPFQPEVGAYSH
ncbi:MAG: urease accessory protein UreE [Cyanobacteriota bacterium]|nr:urease accessory protein UreE [Cyanobacteriota bacterium]